MCREESSDALDRYRRELKRIIGEVAKIGVTELARLCYENGESGSKATIYAYLKGDRPPAEKTSQSLHRVIADVQQEYDSKKIVDHLDHLAHEARLAQGGGQADQERPVETLPVHVGSEAAEAYNDYVRYQLETSERFFFVANSGYRWAKTWSDWIKRRFADESKHSTFILVGGPRAANEKRTARRIANDLVNCRERRRPYGDRQANEGRVAELIRLLRRLGGDTQTMSVYYTTYVVPPWALAIFDDMMLLEFHWLFPDKKIDRQIPFVLVEKRAGVQSFFDYVLGDIEEVIDLADSPPGQWEQGIPPIVRGDIGDVS